MKNTRVPHEPSAAAILAAYRDLDDASRRMGAKAAAERERFEGRQRWREVQRAIVYVCLLGFCLSVWAAACAQVAGS